MSDSERDQRVKFSQRFIGLINPILTLLYRFNISPNHLSVIGAGFCAAAAACIVYAEFFYAGLLFLFGGIFDVMDGALARLGGKQTRFGAYLDAVMDGAGEGLIYVGLVHYYSTQAQPLLATIAATVLLNAMLIRLSRVKADGLGLESKVGLVTRPERVMVMAAGLMLGLVGLTLVLLFFLTTLTVLQRVLHVGNHFKDES